ncbi:MAG: hypothetical protein HY834_19370 [Devosia nanyangense]|uniref:Uncharacterized protein n=1 Tax=Devosia nanyangense TaxID=1228055 RepID=A0A933NYF4_9HYPH|nr:hypothetical protein [Devosia nanyangense]
MSQGFAAKIMRATRWLEHENAVARFTLTIRAFRRALLEQRYRPDQPRVPAGRPEGGEWTVVGSRPEDRTDVAIAGNLIAQRVGLGDKGLVRHCIYLDMLGRQFGFELDASKLCPPTY